MIKELVISFLEDTIAIIKIQHQCRAFVTDITQNIVDRYRKIQKIQIDDPCKFF